MAGSWLLGTDAHPGGAGADGNAGSRPTAVLIGVHGESGQDPQRSLDELARLAETDGLDVAERVLQVKEHPDPATYLGAGEAQEVAAVVRDRGAGVVIADDELSPAQARNLEGMVDARVVDRTALILDIFAEHARSSEGKARVELAQLAYQLPRLRGQGTELSRVGGGRVAGGAGIGVRGPGEMQLEQQRRTLRRRMILLRRQLAQIARRRARTRSRRRTNRVPAVALAGYTNAGKSALLNRLTGADVVVQDLLFATLDPTVRRVAYPDGRTYPLTDTVGFVRYLPHQLVDAFRSTLEELSAADLILHVVDAAAADAIDQITTVREVLDEIDARRRPELLVLNKIDRANPLELAALRSCYPDAVAVSALTGEGIDDLRTAVRSALERERRPFDGVPASAS